MELQRKRQLMKRRKVASFSCCPLIYVIVHFIGGFTEESEGRTNKVQFNKQTVRQTEKVIEEFGRLKEHFNRPFELQFYSTTVDFFSEFAYLSLVLIRKALMEMLT